jgi:hypothetical protein
MTDEELAKHLTNIAYIMETDHKGEWHSGHPVRLREAAARLGRASVPPPPGSVEVRIAVCRTASGVNYAMAIDDAYCNLESMDILRHGIEEPVVAEAVVTCRVPTRVVPTITGEVEPCDPEATT